MSNTTVIQEEKRQNPVAAALDKFFHISERGTTIGSEIGAGIGTFLIAAALLMMNTRIVGAVYGNYAGAYAAITLVSFIGTFLIGILANRPFVVTANLAFSTVLVSTMTAHSGVTYANMLAINFFAGIIALALSILMAFVPAVRKVSEALPKSVVKAIPIAVGLFTMIEGLYNAGIITSLGNLNSTTNKLQRMYLILMFVGVLLYIVYKALHQGKASFKVFGILVGLMFALGILLYQDTFIGGSTATTVVYERLNLIVATDGAAAYNIGIGFKSINWGSCFKEGFNFSAYEGNAAWLFIKGIVVYSLMMVYANAGASRGTMVAADFDVEDETAKKDLYRSYVVSSAVNALSPIIGVTGVTVSTSSAVNADNKGKTGLSSIVASLGFFICLFTWAVFALTATETNGVGMWIELSETKFAAYVQDKFAFADLMMVFAGAMMLKGFKGLDFSEDKLDLIPFIATIAGALVTFDLALGVAIGVLAHYILLLCKKDFDEVKKPELIVLTCGMLLYFVFDII